MNKQNQHLFLIGVFIIALGLLMKRSHDTKNKTDLISSPTSSEDANAPKIMPPSSDNLSNMAAVSSEATQRLTNQIIAQKQLGMISAELPKEGDNSILNVELRIKPGCNPGDADAIAMELKASSTLKLLATIEGMSEGSESFVWEIPNDFLTVGLAKNQFKIKTGDQPIQFGFYLCTAQSSDKTCQDKKAVDLNKIFTEHLTNEGNLGKEARVIFYQYLLLDQTGLSVFENIPKGDQKIKELKNYARENKFQGTKVEEGIDRAKKELQTLLSLPVKLEKDKIGLELPKYDVVECSNQQRAQNK